jgi:hypothetical protein
MCRPLQDERRNAAPEAGARGQTPSVFPLTPFPAKSFEREGTSLGGGLLA